MQQGGAPRPGSPPQTLRQGPSAAAPDGSPRSNPPTGHRSPPPDRQSGSHPVHRSPAAHPPFRQSPPQRRAPLRATGAVHRRQSAAPAWPHPWPAPAPGCGRTPKALVLRLARGGGWPACRSAWAPRQSAYHYGLGRALDPPWAERDDAFAPPYEDARHMIEYTSKSSGYDTNTAQPSKSRSERAEACSRLSVCT